MDEKPKDVVLDGLNQPKCTENFYRKWHDYWLDKKSENTEVLFLAESPPENGLNYFYYTGKNAGQIGFINSLLGPLELRKNSFTSKKERINKFLEKYWLEDLFPKPINYMGTEDIEFRRKELSGLISKIDPKTILFILTKQIFEHKAMELLCSEFGILYNINNFSIIEIQKELLSKQPFNSTRGFVAPFPGQKVPKEWVNGGYKSFSAWFEDNKCLLELNEE